MAMTKPLRKIAPRLRAQLDRPEPGWFNNNYTVLQDGALGILQTTVDYRENLRRWRAAMNNGPGTDRAALLPAQAKARFAAFDGRFTHVTAGFIQDEPTPLFDRMPDGSWIIANARCAPDGENARIIEDDGRNRRRLYLADGISHLHCDRLGNIWTGYFDEGVFSREGWGTRLHGSPGINQFNANGSVLWSYAGDIADCYALNIAADAVWSCVYSKWPIIKIDLDGKTREWEESPKTGASIIAATGRHVVLLGGYSAAGDRPDMRLHGALLELGAPPHLRGEFALDVPADDLGELPLAMGRGDTMHFIVRGNWCRLTVADVAKELGVPL